METKFTELDIFNLIDMFCYKFRTLIEACRNDAYLCGCVADGDKHQLNQLFKDWFLSVGDYSYIPRDEIILLLGCMEQEEYIGENVPDL